MYNTGKTDRDIMERWLHSGLTARISGLDLKPLPHPILPGSPQCVVKGQASVYFMQQHLHDNIWLLKKFIPSRRPTNAHLEAVSRYIPGKACFFTCTQRRILESKHLDRRYSAFKDPELIRWLQDVILMPKVPGSPWASLADALRNGELQMSIKLRLQASLNLANCIELLESCGCSHRDLSSSNVFIIPNGKIYLIDWDCLYHPDLQFEPNTTAGTNGYIAPFMRITSDHWDAMQSWCGYADRFALAILITEFILIGPGAPILKEDGTLFSQAQLDRPKNSFVREQIRLLQRVFPKGAHLLAEAFRAKTFKDCPSPPQWQSALRQVLRIEEHRQHTGQIPTAIARRIEQVCAGCKTRFRIVEARFNELQKQGKSVLCPSCLQRQIAKKSQVNLQRAQEYPEITCEHCLKPFRIPRPKLDRLLNRAKPTLCPSCLPKQMCAWETEQVEYERNYPLSNCSQCGKDFRLRREKIQRLLAAGKSLLCSNCLKVMLSGSTCQTQYRKPNNFY